MNEILYKKELSEEYRIPLATLNWWRHAGQGPRSFKIGNKVCYKRADIEAWVESQYQAERSA
jgi:predicted DNA-binding transcriptional regulator AlpA